MENEKDFIQDGQQSCIEDEVDSRDYSYDEIAMGSNPVDWDKGYDIREELGHDLFPKSQGQSYSCVGQGASIEIEVNEGVEISPKSIYSQINLGKNRGAYIRDAMKYAVNTGANLEVDVPSHKTDGTTDENFMRNKDWITPEMLAKTLKQDEYRVINDRTDMDVFAKAIRDDMGVVSGYRGINNGTVLSERPKPPVFGDNTWGHCVFLGAYGTDEFGRFIATPGSWGKRSWNMNYTWKKGDAPGTGWQKFYIDYFQEYTDGTNKWNWFFNPWVLINNSKNQMIRTIKKRAGANSYEIYLVIEKRKILRPIAGSMSTYNDLLADGIITPFEEVDELPEGYSIEERITICK